jgi:hypothetical protein
MASPVAAPDASPPAAVSVVLLPKGKEVHGITAYAMFKGQQGVPFVRYAACTCTSGWAKLQRIGCQERSSQDVVEEELSRMHGGKDNEFVSVLKTEEKGYCYF